MKNTFETGIINGMPVGTERIDFDNGCYYIGEVKNGKPHGIGKKHRPDPDNSVDYDGEWECGVQHGKGVHFDEYGGRYEVNYEKGRPIEGLKPIT